MGGLSGGVIRRAPHIQVLLLYIHRTFIRPFRPRGVSPSTSKLHGYSNFLRITFVTALINLKNSSTYIKPDRHGQSHPHILPPVHPIAHHHAVHATPTKCINPLANHLADTFGCWWLSCSVSPAGCGPSSRHLPFCVC